MFNPLAVMSALGGLVVFLTAITVVARGIFRQTSATEENTKAVKRLTEAFTNHESRISRVEGILDVKPSFIQPDDQ
jgi:hypothetical protein